MGLVVRRLHHIEVASWFLVSLSTVALVIKYAAPAPTREGLRLPSWLSFIAVNVWIGRRWPCGPKTQRSPRRTSEYCSTCRDWPRHLHLCRIRCRICLHRAVQMDAGHRCNDIDLEWFQAHPAGKEELVALTRRSSSTVVCACFMH